MNRLQQFWQDKPLASVLILGLVMRLVAVVFATGYGYHDDHFVVIESAESWLNGLDWEDKITTSPETNTSGRSLLYHGINYVILGLPELFGVDDPFSKMTFNRLVHALYSLLIIYFGFRLTEELSDRKSARTVGLLLAVFWMFPQMSVRVLAEVVPIPLMMAGSLLLIKFLKGDKKTSYLIIAGLLMALSFSLRYQTIFFAAGLGIGLLGAREWKGAILYGVTALGSIALIHGIGDYFLCGSPFCKVYYYFTYDHLYEGITKEPWHFYLVILLGVFVPPLSILLIFGWFRSFKISFTLWSATIFFFVFHSAFPNKQERFIFTIMPLIIVLGYLGWQHFANSRKESAARNKLVRFSWVFFWCLNIPMLFLYSTYDNKTARTRGVAYITTQDDFKGFMMLDTKARRVKDAPLYYGDYFGPYIKISRSITPDSTLQILTRVPDDQYPNYLVLTVSRNEKREDVEKEARKYIPEFSYLTTTRMGMVDAFRNKLNPGLELDDWMIYRIEGERLIPHDPNSEPLLNMYTMDEGN